MVGFFINSTAKYYSYVSLKTVHVCFKTKQTHFEDNEIVKKDCERKIGTLQRLNVCDIWIDLENWFVQNQLSYISKLQFLS